MQKILQLINEAIEEIEKYGSCESAYYLLKYIASHGEKFIEEKSVNYDFTLDNIILMSVLQETHKYKLFVSSFFIYDYLSKKFRVQEPLFIFRWGKTYFIYSYRINARLESLIKNQFIFSRKGILKLTKKGENERENIFSSLPSTDRKKIEEIIDNIDKMKLKELRIYTKKYLFSIQ
ncbi:hypothetical protein [Sulfurisphaera ohwakuensis]|uniref:Uncharacterized protein n=1 Tax=Sulfurisphaera ohwakuensis TaxID=69656 RepID=A0A650CGA2_SULOH|nr:hypothetical protein [Sulfurisphaera ohwakuensis]MBB5254251.1 hypothetical protein [Sulfurisphaera ohwakuensis]QGR16842.1 hypothetical protein D1869_06310 [Sulfurisphaera ohwakuensis]